MLADQKFRRAPHGFHVRFPVQHRHILPVEHRLRLADIARVRVELAHGAIARVEAVGRLFHLGHADVVRQIVIEIIADGLRLHVRVHVGVCDHRPRMNARVRPACADHVDRRAAHPREHGLELALNGLLARLTLPAEIAGAVIAERHLEIFHPRGSTFFV